MIRTSPYARYAELMQYFVNIRSMDPGFARSQSDGPPAALEQPRPILEVELPPCLPPDHQWATRLVGAPGVSAAAAIVFDTTPESTDSTPASTAVMA
jgi:hypothetical protein